MVAKRRRAARKPVKARKKKGLPEEGGPREWLVPVIESAYSKLVPREKELPEEEIADAEAEAAQARAKKRKRPVSAKPRPLASRLQPGRGEDVLGETPRDFWVQRLKQYQERKATAAAKQREGSAAVPFPGMPAVPGANNWVSIGPAAIARGQAIGRPTIGGRVSGIAIASGGIRMYAATANGGVFRSDNGGNSWRSMMDGFDLDPNNFASTSLACGAIATSPANADRVYVGTGEGDTDALFTLRLTNALPSYRGIGPIRSDDGGGNWVPENSSPSLAGFAFYQLAVDAGNPDNVVAATTNGLYQRTISGGSPLWQQRRTGNHSSVVVARSGSTTTFYTAAWGGPVYTSTDGTTWSAVGTGFPSASVGRIALGVQVDNPNVLYALVANSSGGMLGVYRLDGGGGSWRNISGTPNLLPGGQGDYDLCIAVDPNNSNLIYLGGDRTTSSPYPGNIQRCAITSSGGNYSMTATAIGAQAHADVHVLALSPGVSNALWAGTDGGCFLNASPAGSGIFEARNTGLSCLCTNYMGMSPSEPALIYAGLQDNGTARYLGEELWRHVLFGDGGYCAVHPTDPFQALAYANGTVYRTTSGGQDYANWTIGVSPPWSIMAEPLVEAPGTQRVAFGAGSGVYVSNDFGATWSGSPSFSLPAGSGGIYSMAFANDTRLFIGTTNGRVFRSDLSGGSWTAPVRIDNAVSGPLPLTGLVSDIAIDWSDASRQSIYICFGGQGDTRHVWRYDGTAWQARSGSGGSSLIDVEHNAIVADPANPSHVYVGADVGVWRSTDGGMNWNVLQNGLPDAPVFDLQIHDGYRLLRASTHGRGLYEYQLDPPPLSGVQLYVRDTELDTARGENTDGRNDPSRWPTRVVAHWVSPNIKIDAPTPAGYQTPTNQIDFWQFHETIVDGSQGVGTIDPPLIVHNRVYVLVHNRGPLTASSVRVTAAVTNASTVLNLLPAGYTANIQAGTPLSGPDWTTLGFVTLSDLRAGFPQVAAFDLPSNLLPLPASLPGQSHFCLMSFVHSADDVYTATERNVDTLTVQERKVAQRNLHIVQFVGTPPPPSATIGMWARLDITGFPFKDAGKIDLVFDLRRFPGKLSVVLPQKLLPSQLTAAQRDFTAKPNGTVKTWYERHSRDVERLLWEGKYSREDFTRLLKAMKLASERPALQPRKDSTVAVLKGLPIHKNDRHTVFLRIDPPRGAKVGDSWAFSIAQRDARNGRIQGGADYLVRINRPVKG